jgi:hypothetical protein
MKVRMLDDDGDYRLGHGTSDFYDDAAEGVAQNVRTRLALWRGQWFLNTEEGTPWLQEILGYRNAADAIIKARILGTPGVTEIESFESVFDPDERRLSVTATINTVYGKTTISEAFS